MYSHVAALRSVRAFLGIITASAFRKVPALLAMTTASTMTASRLTVAIWITGNSRTNQGKQPLIFQSAEEL